MILCKHACHYGLILTMVHTNNAYRYVCLLYTVSHGVHVLCSADALSYNKKNPRTFLTEVFSWTYYTVGSCLRCGFGIHWKTKWLPHDVLCFLWTVICHAIKRKPLPILSHIFKGVFLWATLAPSVLLGHSGRIKKGHHSTFLILYIISIICTSLYI